MRLELLSSQRSSTIASTQQIREDGLTHLADLDFSNVIHVNQASTICEGSGESDDSGTDWTPTPPARWFYHYGDHNW